MKNPHTDDEIKKAVQQTYGSFARRFVQAPAAHGCCGAAAEPATARGCCEPAPASAGSDCCSESGGSTGAAALYDPAELVDLPETVTGAAAGCGNPTAIAELRAGETVLDLGSGGGIDCFLAARKVGPAGRVVGLDMTPEMIKLARRNARKLGVTNVEFQWGEIEEIPLPDETVDVVISNCVINLSPDKDAVFGEAYRVLRPGGRLAISDMVIDGELPAAIRSRLDSWASCVAGALDEKVYLEKIRAAGFDRAQVTSRDYVNLSEADWKEVEGALRQAGVTAAELDHKVASIKVRAVKPA